MIKLIPVTEENWMDIASLTVKEHQRNYVAPAIGILARGYVYRDCNVKIYAFEEDGAVVGIPAFSGNYEKHVVFQIESHFTFRYNQIVVEA